MAQQPHGEPLTTPGALPDSALAVLGQRPFGVYVHVPWCVHRCGYCDFNTYVPGTVSGIGPESFASTFAAELATVVRAFGDHQPPPPATLFFGGGTPNLLPPEQLAAVIAELEQRWGLAPDIEITVECNPEAASRQQFEQLRSAGVNRLSVGMQSSDPAVLSTLERRHTPGAVSRVVEDARSVGFDSVSLDLIYGTPGESDSSWERTLHEAVGLAPDHVSAYSLIIEDGTRMARMARTGQVAETSSDTMADRYLIADDVLSTAGYQWYEVSNWARPPDGDAIDSAVAQVWRHASRHNLSYWHDHDWWGFGPGAHSHIGPLRCWNLKNPRQHAQAAERGELPVAGHEILSGAARHIEAVMLGIRTRWGVSGKILTRAEQHRADELVEQGLLQRNATPGDRWYLTDRGRLLADLVTRELLAAGGD